MLDPLPEHRDFSDEILADILRDASSVLGKLAGHIAPSLASARDPLPHLNAARALRLAEIYVRSTRAVVTVLGAVPADDELDYGMDELGLDGPLRRPRQRIAPPPGTDPALQMVANIADIATAQRLPGLMASLESARKCGDVDLEARIRALIDEVLPPPLLAPAAYEGPADAEVS